MSKLEIEYKPLTEVAREIDEKIMEANSLIAISLDFEFSKTDVATNLIQIGAQIFNAESGKILTELSHIINPFHGMDKDRIDECWNDNAEKIHGINLDSVIKSKYSTSDMLSELNCLIKAYDVGIVVGDEIINSDLPLLDDAYINFDIENKVGDLISIDSAAVTRYKDSIKIPITKGWDFYKTSSIEFNSDHGSFSQSKLADIFFIQNDNAHNALSDARVAKKVFMSLYGLTKDSWKRIKTRHKTSATGDYFGN